MRPKAISVTVSTLFVSISVLAASVTHGGDWPRFRGPNGTGVSPDKTATPVKWSPTENLKWKVALPGAGVSSPIVIGDRVFVTCYSGYGLNRRDPGDMKKLKRHLVCINRKTGKILWDKSVKAVLPEDTFRGMGVPEHGYASHTPVSDGKNVYVFFGKSGALAFDMQGNKIWQKSVGTGSDQRRWGSSSSPILYKNLLIVTASAENEAMVALDTKTGKQVWKQKVDGFQGLWGTPVLVKIDENRTDLVVGVPYEIWALNPKTGKLLWYCDAMETDQFNSSVVVADKTIYAIEGRGGGSIAVRAGGKGNVTKSHVVWTGRHSSRFSTPVAYEGRLYFVSRSVANCVNAKTGATIFKARLRGGSGGGGRQGGGRFGGSGGDYSSPIIADGKVYYTTRSGDIFVLKAGKKFEQLAVNRVTKDREDFSASPAVSNGELFFRSNKHLYCVAAKAAK